MTDCGSTDRARGSYGLVHRHGAVVEELHGLCKLFNSQCDETGHLVGNAHRRPQGVSIVS